MRYLRLFVSAILSGVFISIGGIAFLTVENKEVGALLFSVGLLAICTNSLALYTGKVCYCLDDRNNIMDLPFVWLGNLIGTVISSYLISLTRISTICARAKQICLTKINDDLLSIFILALFCNFLIYLAVDGYKNNHHQLGKYLSLLFGIVIFVTCGFEHCVANMFYFSLARMWSKKSIIFIIVNTLGNSIGGISIHLVKKFIVGGSYENKKVNY